jgi:hypothetical protein
MQRSEGSNVKLPRELLPYRGLVEARQMRFTANEGFRVTFVSTLAGLRRPANQRVCFVVLLQDQPGPALGPCCPTSPRNTLAAARPYTCAKPSSKPAPSAEARLRVSFAAVV